ncbi:hypothetical protein WKK05_31390 [Nostoc sp. UHCC 0302]|uniref:hypothetical protein n=1 Tax=Nostoc sp. UHCC 0302 TaxID=3134896 RepID=UPI00311C9C01
MALLKKRKFLATILISVTTTTEISRQAQDSTNLGIGHGALGLLTSVETRLIASLQKLGVKS